MPSVMILGATGMVGRECLALALADRRVDAVVAPTRRALAAAPKLRNPVVDFTRLPAADWWRVDAVVCALGTTMAQAGSPEAFRRIDHDLVLDAARRARDAGARVFVLNSSLGASATARSFYLRVKADTERDLVALGLPSVTLARPSLLDTARRPDSRPAERLGLWAARALRPLLPGRWRAVGAQAVAAAMLEAALAARPGVWVLESEALQDGAKAAPVPADG